MNRVPNEILQKVKLLEIKTRRLVNDVYSGEYKTHFKGQGMTFAEFREYVPGDDVRAISWALTARTGKTFIKKFDEERELTVILAVDVSGSGAFGSGLISKGEALVHLSALLSLGAVQSKDQVGLLLFSNQIEHYVPPGKGLAHVHRLLRDLYFFRPKQEGTKISEACAYLRGVLKKRATIFLLSDFLDSEYESALKALSKKHEVVAVFIEDPLETQFPAMGLFDIEDPETGEIITIDSGSAAFRESLKKQQKQLDARRQDSLRRAQIDQIKVVNGQSYVDPVLSFFRRRRKA